MHSGRHDNKKSRTEEVGTEYLGLDGRGLTSILITREVLRLCDLLGPQNKLILAPDLPNGAPLVNTVRSSILAKSPLTGTIKESNMGGTVAADLGHLES